MPDTKRSSFRLSESHLAMVDSISEYQGGLTKTRVIEWAIERLHDAVQDHRKKSKKLPDSRLDVS